MNTTAPPPSRAAWDADGKNPGPQVPRTDPDLEALDDGTEEEAEGEVIEPEDAGNDNEPVENFVNGNQLTMKIAGGRLKPTQSTLKVRARTREFGTTKEWKIGDRVEFNGVLEVRKVEVEQKSNGRIVRIQHAIITECDLLDEAAD